MNETESLLIDNLERHRAGDAATANLIADAAKALRHVTEDRELWRISEENCSNQYDNLLVRLHTTISERDALRKHADTLAGAMEEAKAATRMLPEHWKAMDTALAAYTAYLIDGGNDA